jgi:hypothetical protein
LDHRVRFYTVALRKRGKLAARPGLMGFEIVKGYSIGAAMVTVTHCCCFLLLGEENGLLDGFDGEVGPEALAPLLYRSDRALL